MKNVLEEMVSEVYAQLKARHTEFCACERCHDDVIAQALNKARPRYIGGSPLGAAVTRVSLAGDQARAEIACRAQRVSASRADVARSTPPAPNNASAPSLASRRMAAAAPTAAATRSPGNETPPNPRRSPAA